MIHRMLQVILAEMFPGFFCQHEEGEKLRGKFHFVFIYPVGMYASNRPVLGASNSPKAMGPHYIEAVKIK